MQSYLRFAAATLVVAALTVSTNEARAQAPRHTQNGTLGPIAYWKFDEGVGRTASDYMGRYNATLDSGDAWVPGIINDAIHLNGTPNACVSIPAGIVSNLSDFSISTWVKVDINATWNRIFDFGTGTNTYMFLSPDSASNTVRYAITTSGNPGEQVVEGNGPLTVGIWHNVVVTQSQSVGILYVDGIKAGENDNITLRPFNLGLTTQNYIGKSQWPADPTLLGAVDDFRIYNRALSASEVMSLAHLAIR